MTEVLPPRPSPAGTPRGRDESRLRHLFRQSLKTGRIHPLYLHMLRHRQTRGTP